MLTKPIDQIVASDVQALCDRGAYESESLEFKRDLPGDTGQADSWNAGGKVKEKARDSLFREIVAFANAQGGTLVLGIEETKDKPSRAKEIMPVSRVHELADRLQEAARGCIEPPLGSLQIRSVETQEDGKGVVIFRTAASLAGPHRVRREGHAFIRRGPSSVQMTMREIQDLTLDLARGAERLEGKFVERAALFEEWVRTSATEVGAFRITAMPLAGFPGVSEIMTQGRVPGIQGRSRHNVMIDSATVECTSLPQGAIRPIVRGFRLHAQDDSTRTDVLSSGLVDMWSRHPPVEGKHFYVHWMLGSYLFVLSLIESFRTITNSPDFEFALEFSLSGHTIALRAGGGTMPLHALLLGAPNAPQYTWRVGPLPITFPRLTSRRLGDREDIINIAMRDLFDAVGEPLPWSVLKLSA